MESKVFTVSELTFAIKTKLETSFAFVRIKGEISNAKLHSSGHFYFTLKDEKAQISAVLFKGSRKNLTKIPKDGDHIIAYGEISLYPPRGSYQVLVREIHFLGVGELLQLLFERKQKLQALGYFSSDKKKTLPQIPKRIGVISSPTGAVIQDILHVLERRFCNIQLLLNPVKVQGEGASAQIAKAIEDFNTHNLVDVIILARGGGSLEDLWPFNEENVAHSIYASNIPIISAVGHETDQTIADLVADVRAPTPSAAAEIVTAQKEEILSRLQNIHLQIGNACLEKAKRVKTYLSAIQKQPVLLFPQSLLSNKMQAIDEKRERIDNEMKQYICTLLQRVNSFSKQLQSSRPDVKISYYKNSLLSYKKNVYQSFFHFLEKRKEKLKTIAERMRDLDPKNLLKKGYSFLFSEKDGSLILSSKDLDVGDRIYTHLQDGKIYSTITKKELKKES